MKKLITIIVALLFVKVGFSCTCWEYEADFYQNVYKTGFNCIAVFDTMTIQSIDNVEQDIQVGKFIVIDTINTGEQIGDTILVLGSSGANCGEQINFKNGDTLALSLAKSYIDNFVSDTFYLEGICGKHYLKITNGTNDNLTIEEIIQKAKYEMTNIDQNTIFDNLKIYPNPVNDKLQISYDNLLIDKIKIINNLGKLIYQSNKINKSNITIDLSPFDKGIYIIDIMTQNQKFTKSIVKL